MSRLLDDIKQNIAHKLEEYKHELEDIDHRVENKISAQVDRIASITHQFGERFSEVGIYIEILEEQFVQEGINSPESLALLKAALDDGDTLRVYTLLDELKEDTKVCDMSIRSLVGANLYAIKKLSAYGKTLTDAVSGMNPNYIAAFSKIIPSNMEELLASKEKVTREEGGVHIVYNKDSFEKMQSNDFSKTLKDVMRIAEAHQQKEIIMEQSKEQESTLELGY